VPDETLEDSFWRPPDELRSYLGERFEFPADLIKAGQFVFGRDLGKIGSSGMTFENRGVPALHGKFHLTVPQ
jgi:hypothetical protein